MYVAAYSCACFSQVTGIYRATPQDGGSAKRFVVSNSSMASVRFGMDHVCGRAGDENGRRPTGGSSVSGS